MNVNDPDITEENYMRVIYSKTARLFEAAAQCSGILAGCTEAQEKGLRDYGRYLGTAFQLIDDLLDYSADGETLGKNVGDDLNEGKPTLPLLHAMRNGTADRAKMIREAIEQEMAAIFWNLYWKPWQSADRWNGRVSVQKKKPTRPSRPFRSFQTAHGARH